MKIFKKTIHSLAVVMITAVLAPGTLSANGDGEQTETLTGEESIAEETPAFSDGSTEESSTAHSSVAAHYQLTVRTDPPGAIVKIMNIKPKYRHGILLKSGAYDVLVTKERYRPVRSWIRIDNADMIYHLSLSRGARRDAVDAFPYDQFYRRNRQQHLSLSRDTRRDAIDAFPYDQFYRRNQQQR